MSDDPIIETSQYEYPIRLSIKERNDLIAEVLDAADQLMRAATDTRVRQADQTLMLELRNIAVSIQRIALAMKGA